MALRCRSLSRVFIFELSFCMPGNEHWYILGFRDHLPLNATSWFPSEGVADSRSRIQQSCRREAVQDCRLRLFKIW